MTKRYCLTLDLKNDPKLIAEYKRYHEKIWPEITKSIKDAGIVDLEIYLLGTRMFMIMEVNEQFSFESKGKADRENPKVQRVGRTDVEISAATSGSQAGRKMAVDGKNLRTGRIIKPQANARTPPPNLPLQSPHRRVTSQISRKQPTHGLPAK